MIMCNELETFCAVLKTNHSGLYSVGVKDARP